MAERRMFAKAIVNSARFLRMPPTSRLLYYDLGMAADDDGIVEAFTVMRMTGGNEDDLRVLVARGFVRILNDDLVSHILDWKQNNLIKRDRYHPSVYASLLVEIQDGTHLEPERNPFGTQSEPESSLGEIRPGEVVENHSSSRPNFDTVEGYAANNLACLSPGNMQDLAAFKEQLPEDMIRHAIDEACAAGKRNFSYVRSILRRYLDAGFKTLGDVRDSEAMRRKPVQAVSRTDGDVADLSTLYK